MENKITTIVIIGLLLSAIFAITPIAVSSSASAVSVEPSYLNVSSGDTFTVNITIDPAGNEIYGAQFYLYFDPTMLNATSQTQGNFLSQDGASASVIINKINNNIGKIEYGEFRLGVEHGVTGCGVLASITFEVTGASGKSDLKLSDVILSDPNGIAIQNVTINHGTIEIEAKPVTVFDTGSPENPYPSIMGVHNGTIIPSYNIPVDKIYTYPCTGTGGHTEYIKIWNETIGDYAEAQWDGYIGDYHNISFNRTLTLKKGVVYNYTLRTGSYPQIVHAKEYPAIGGEIKCKEFIGANGKRYTDWIPAIRLYQ